MKQKSRYRLGAAFVLLASLAFWIFTPSHKQIPEILVYGASVRGSYFRTANYLATRLNERLGGKYRFKAQSSAGSVENIRDLQAGKAQVALIQEDVAHYFYHGGHSVLQLPHKNDSNIQSLGFCFHEYVFVLARPGKGLRDLRKVYIGSIYSGSRITAINIHNELKDELRYEWQLESGKDPVTALEDGADASIVLTANLDFVTDELRKKNIDYHVLSFGREEIASITTSFPFYREAHVQCRGFHGEKVKINTISTRALLAVNRKLPPEVTKTILNTFIDPKEYRKFSDSCPEVRNFEISQPKFMAKRDPRFSQFPMPMHPVIFELYCGGNPYAPFFLASVPLFIICLVLLYLRRKKRYRSLLKSYTILGIDVSETFAATWGYLLLLIFILLYLISAAYLTKYLEIQAFLRNEISDKSRFISMNFRQLCTWIIVFTVTGYEDEIFPYTQMGKIVASSIRIATLGGVMFVVGRISADYLQNLVKGRKMMKGHNLKNHVVICNWNEKGKKVVEELHSPLLKAHGMARPVVVIADFELTFPDSPEFEDTFWIPGDPLSSWKLRNANVQDAFTILLLADYKRKESADTHTIMVAMEISEIVEEMLSNKTIDKKPHIAAELIEGKNTKYVQRAGASEVVSGNDLGVRMLAQAAVTPGITYFMADLLKYSSDTNEVYILDPPGELVESKADFVKISHFLLSNRQNNEYSVLVGIQKLGQPQMLVNPDKNDFPGLEPGDQLVIMARSKPNL